MVVCSVGDDAEIGTVPSCDAELTGVPPALVALLVDPHGTVMRSPLVSVLTLEQVLEYGVVDPYEGTDPRTEVEPGAEAELEGADSEPVAKEELGVETRTDVGVDSGDKPDAV